MKTFIQKHSGEINGVLSGFDRLVFRGTIRTIAYTQGLLGFLWAAGVLLKEFVAFALERTKLLRESTLATANLAGRPLIYLPSSRTSKEETARAIAEADGIREGLICVLSAVEPCNTFEIFRNRERKRLELHPKLGKCLHLYNYLIHPVFGFMNARIQTWFPFNIQICLNGREWLARIMDQAGIGYIRRENCFTWLEDVDAAQRLMDGQLRVSWPALLDEIARMLDPLRDEFFKDYRADYYWSAHQSEWATDVMFNSGEALAAIYPQLVRHGMTTFQSPDVMRFLGKKIAPGGAVPANLKAEVISDFKKRPEGVRIKHRLGRNSIKLYDKQQSVLRVETTINDASCFKAFRAKEGEPEGEKQWRPMRKGVADLNRRAEVSQAANERYLGALAQVENRTKLSDVVDGLCRPTKLKGKRVRALNPYSEQDAELLQAVNRGEFAINGFRNRDLQGLLFPAGPISSVEKRRRSSAVTRKIRLLRAHGLVKKVPRTHRYHLTEKGRTAVVALLAAQNADVDSLAKLAA